MLYMTHTTHGATHFYSEDDAKAAEKNGWIRAEWPPRKIETASEPVIIESRGTEVQPRKRGRPVKVTG